MKFKLNSLNLKRKKIRYISLVLEIDPKSKKATKNKSKIQKTIIDKMQALGHQKIKGKVAIEITAYTSTKNPPQIEKFVKNLIDIMHKKELLTDINDEALLPFDDDKLIKFLSAKYVFIDGPSTILIKVWPFSSFVSDINFIDSEIGFEENERENYTELVRRYNKFVAEKEQYLKVTSPEAYASMLKLMLHDLQKSFTNTISLTPKVITFIYPKRTRFASLFKGTTQQWAEMLIKVPVRLQLPGIPLDDKSDEEYKITYKASIKTQIEAYLDRYNVLQDLQSPIIVSVFYCPPSKMKSHYKDIDNIMLEYVVPGINQVFLPPITLFNLDPDRFKSVAPKSLRGSAIGYEIIELPQKFDATGTGYIALGFKMDTGDTSTMEYVDRTISRYLSSDQ